MKDFNELLIKYKSDKSEHGYGLPYQKNLPETCDALLEVGCLKGAGLRAFDEYYAHKADIHALDLFEEPGNITVRECRELNFVPHKGSETDLNFLETIKWQYSVISEDASHNSYDQIAAFKHLFLHNLKQGGLWITEDLHCCTDSFYWASMEEIKSVDDTMLGLAKKFIETGKIVNPFFNEGESEVFESLIARMELCAEDKLLFVWRK